MQPTDVAVIGLACRFPAAATPGEFWRVIRDGREVTRSPAVENRAGQQRAGLLDDVAGFDADFFNVSPREARAMDPRQRLALELTWELFEDAFVVPRTVRGQRVAVYLGAMTDDYALLTLSDAPHNLDYHSFAGVSRGMIANRISYSFGLQGPSMTIDTGQSSSLVAVHMACESLRSGESALAIAGGVHLNLLDETATLETEFGAVSPSGHTYAFDSRADGYVRGEGGGLVLLKPLRAAVDDGNRIRAIIRGSAAGNAGHSAAGQTAPSVDGQADVIRSALRGAGLANTDIDYIEAHGTGTAIGDPVEARALGEIFADRRHGPVSVGSVKTNIGHAGGAAGIAGLLKAVLAIENAVIPPSLNYVSANPEIDLNSLGLQVNTTLRLWREATTARRAGVSSFGMGGTNAHVIVEEPPAKPETVAAKDEPMPVAWVVSGRSEQALSDQAARLSANTTADTSPVDVGWSLASARTIFEHRAVLIGADPEALKTGLAELAAGDPGAAVVGRARPMGKTVFVFPGQGSQWLGMGAQLHGRFPEFARAFDAAAEALDGHLRLPLRRAMWGDDADLLHHTEFAQPALFAIEVALAALLRQWGVAPDVVMGHSVGEITAAHVAGVISLQDAAMMVAARGRLMAALPAGGVMIAVAAGEDEVVPLLTDGVSIAAANGPNAVVISGAQGPTGVVADTLARKGRRVHRLAVSHAFHSVLMEPMLEEWARLVAGVDAAEPRIAVVSNVTGQLAQPGYGSADYWVEHVRQPVRFVDGVRAAESMGAGAFVEVGPGAALTASVEQSLTAEHPVSVITMAKDRPEAESVLAAAGRLFTTGVDVNWTATFTGVKAQRVELPTYAFQRQRFWVGEGAEAPAQRVKIRPAGLVERLTALPPSDQSRQLEELVCAHAAAVLGHTGGADIDPARAFQDLGFESLTGVELRNRLKAETGLALSRTLIFDYPTPTALADYLGQQLFGTYHQESNDEKIWSLLRKIPIQELRRTGLLDKLLLLAGSQGKSLVEPIVSDETIDALNPDDLIAMALKQTDEDDIT